MSDLKGKLIVGDRRVKKFRKNYYYLFITTKGGRG